MKKQVEYCDWCKDDEEATHLITLGSQKGSYLCDNCSNEFIRLLRNDYLRRIKFKGRRNNERKDKAEEE